jgi:hypothetical protein
MDSASIIARLKYICDNEYSENTSLFTLYSDVIQFQDYIRERTSPELYQHLCTELDCVFNEARFGDGVYADYVFNDCIDVLKEIVEEIEE